MNGNKVSASNQEQQAGQQQMVGDEGDHDPDDLYEPLKGEQSQEIQRHDEVKAYINKIFMRQLYVYMSYCVTFYSRTNIFVLFCETLDGYKNDDTWLLGLFVYLSYVSSALMSIGFGSIGDRWRFDYLLLIAALFDIITFWIEATAKNVYTIGIAYAVGGQPFVAIIASWNLKVNQLYYAKQFVSTMHIIATVGSLLGACLGSILASYFNYRLVFYIAACLACVQFFYCLIFFWDCQTTITQQTSLLKQYYDKYPIAASASVAIDDKKNNYNTFDVMNENIKWKISKDYRFPGGMTSAISKDSKLEKDKITLWQILSEMNKYRLFLIAVFNFICSALFVNETAIITYYSAYIIHALNGTLLISGLQIGLYCIGNAIACVIVKKIVAYVEKQKTRMHAKPCHDQTGVRYNLTNLLVLAGFVCIVMNFIIGVIVMHVQYYVTVVVLSRTKSSIYYLTFNFLLFIMI